MTSAFNILTAGGARFNKSKFEADHQLFSKSKITESKGKGKRRAWDGINDTALPSDLNLFHDPSTNPSQNQKRKRRSSGASSSSSPSTSSDGDHENSINASLPTPPQQKITISGPQPLPKSLHPTLISLITHPLHPLPSKSGKPLLRALEESNIKSLWGVQTSVGGCMLDGKDVMCIAPTGSGKTLAYVLPILVQLRDPSRILDSRKDNKEDVGGFKGDGIRAIIVAPTHDLAVQIESVVKAVTRGRKWRVILLSKATEQAVSESAPGPAIGEEGRRTDEGRDEADDESDDDEDAEDTEGENATDIKPLASQASKGNKKKLGIDILIATPERLHHLVSNRKMSLEHTRHLILDESDRLLSPDFLDQIKPIIESCPKSIQKCLFSATMPAGSEALAKKWLKGGGVRIVVGVKDSAVKTVSQSLIYTSSESGKLLSLQSLLSTGQLPYPSLIFVQSIERADQLYKQISILESNVRVGIIHGNKSIKARDETVQAFREGKIWVLVVTEVMARGMDFGGVKVVLNYDFPQTVQSYIHRIGRTGRAGRPGKAITFFSDEDKGYLRTIANVLIASGCQVPQYILDLPKPSKNTKKQIAKAPPKRKVVGGGGRDLAREERKRRADMKKGSMNKKSKNVEQEEEGED